MRRSQLATFRHQLPGERHRVAAEVRQCIGPLANECTEGDAVVVDLPPTNGKQDVRAAFVPVILRQVGKLVVLEPRWQLRDRITKLVRAISFGIVPWAVVIPLVGAAQNGPRGALLGLLFAPALLAIVWLMSQLMIHIFDRAAVAGWRRLIEQLDRGARN